MRNEEDDEEEVFMGTIQSKVDSTKAKEKSWTTMVTINGRRQIEFKVDTGADVTVIPPMPNKMEGCQLPQGL